MKTPSLKNYTAPLLLLVFMLFSNFLNTKLFNFDENNFAVWFVLSFLCFAAGYFVNKVSGWRNGGIIIFSVIITAVFISMFIIIYFTEFFNINKLIAENLILYSLRNIMLGSMCFFGMAIAEILQLKKNELVLIEKISLTEKMIPDVKKEAELLVREAKIEASSIINKANLEVKELSFKKERIENELKEFINAEKELIKRYEELN